MVQCVDIGGTVLFGLLHLRVGSSRVRYGGTNSMPLLS